MSRYIDADKIPWTDLNDNLNSNIKVLVTFAEKVNRMPTADVRENVRGEWIFPYGDKKYKRCSVCGRVFYSIPYNTNFCPNCGADMRG